VDIGLFDGVEPTATVKIVVRRVMRTASQDRSIAFLECKRCFRWQQVLTMARSAKSSNFLEVADKK
jgi:hypothetical protein